MLTKGDQSTSIPLRKSSICLNTLLLLFITFMTRQYAYNQVSATDIYSAIHNNNYPMAIGYANQIFKQNPDNGLGFYIKALVNYEFAKYSESLSNIDSALIQNKQDAGFYILKAKILVKQNYYSEAFKILELAEQYIIVDEEFLRSKCAIFLEQYRSTKITQYLNDALYCINSNNLDKSSLGLSLRATIYDELGEFEKSLNDINTVISLNPMDIQGYQRKGNILMKNHEYRMAIISFSEAIRLEPNDYIAFYRRGISRYELGEFKEALDDFNTCIELDENDFDFYMWRAKTYWQLNDKGNSCHDFRKASEFKLTAELEEYLGKCK